MLSRRRLYDVALSVVNQYRVSELFEMESVYLRDCPLEPIRRSIRRNIFLIQKFLALDCVNVTISQDQNTISLGDNELLSIVKAKVGEILFKDPSIARQVIYSPSFQLIYRPPGQQSKLDGISLLSQSLKTNQILK